MAATLDTSPTRTCACVYHHEPCRRTPPSNWAICDSCVDEFFARARALRAARVPDTSGLDAAVAAQRDRLAPKGR